MFVLDVEYPNYFIVFNGQHEPVVVLSTEEAAVAVILELKAAPLNALNDYRIVPVAFKS